MNMKSSPWLHIITFTAKTCYGGGDSNEIIRWIRLVVVLGSAHLAHIHVTFAVYIHTYITFTVKKYNILYVLYINVRLSSEPPKMLEDTTYHTPRRFLYCLASEPEQVICKIAF